MVAQPAAELVPGGHSPLPAGIDLVELRASFEPGQHFKQPVLPERPAEQTGGPMVGMARIRAEGGQPRKIGGGQPTAQIVRRELGIQPADEMQQLYIRRQRSGEIAVDELDPAVVEAVLGGFRTEPVP
jgi:hypothetical protein